MEYNRTSSASSMRTRKQVREILSQGASGNAVELRDVGIGVIDSERDQLAALEKVKKLACPIQVKRQLREKIKSIDVVPSEGWDHWKAQQASERKRLKQSFENFSYKFELWRNSFKEIEGILSYFLFLKWLMQLNLFISILLMIFIVIPQGILGTSDQVPPAPCNNSYGGNGSSLSFYQDLDYYGEVVPTCSATYKAYIIATSGIQNGTYEVVSYIADFFQGTGFMEDTSLFYGFYSSSSLNVNIKGISDYVETYNLPLAYLLVTIIYLLTSLILMIRSSARGYRDNLSESGVSTSKYSSKAFTSWDYALSDARNIVLKKKGIYQHITHDLHEDRDLERRNARSNAAKCFLWTKRVAVNLFVLGCLGGSGYVIYLVTHVSTEATENKELYESWHTAVQLLVQFSPSLTLTALSSVLPVLFEKIALLEDYLPQNKVQITLLRTVFFRLSSLVVLLISMYTDITCDTKDECNVGSGECQALHCWETGIGQQLYRLVITDAIAKLIVTIFVEFPRKMRPSTGCGPFRPYHVMYNAFTATICEWPKGFQTFLSVVTSTGFTILVILMLSCTIYYQQILIQSQKSRLSVVQDQFLAQTKENQSVIKRSKKPFQ
ncbi:TMC7 [Bugula neritina]|uniref:TMC7 n=1 Tax=Bugula neritina TaxID=10212 RepID=A0A7J7IVX7_BUGNE|nr:TMC7 [Bugula neritina]